MNVTGLSSFPELGVLILLIRLVHNSNEKAEIGTFLNDCNRRKSEKKIFNLTRLSNIGL